MPATGFRIERSSLEVMGYFGFLLARAWYERSVGSLLLAIVAVAVYGGAVWGALPLVRSGISWEMHLFGLLAGVLAARLGSVGGHRRSVQDELLI